MLTCRSCSVIHDMPQCSRVSSTHVVSCIHASPHAPNLLVVIVHVHECSIIVLKQHARNTCSDRMLRQHAQLRNALKLMGSRSSCHADASKNSPMCQVKSKTASKNCIVVKVVDKQQQGWYQCTACVTGCLRQSRRYTFWRPRTLHRQLQVSSLAGDLQWCSCPLLS